ncbi:hypothetical protein AZO1586R_1839 [Bathymodiolus azoricus thioautotrophic gill symbiont]|uniref:Uncharacterized protein n=1 Tax=Bathymodiolus azoricus thioautotrophic gill symbiont TaxID=235205 RepID=A0ACA8ZUG7_9GAMM|nr:hypothetical protein AZO1586R_1839 [Bathymodiolus azoricus thioautotrophic gill symbiont]CAC5816945.1 hypothetical protein [uncultured Gammaproteobacteria bacterium]CAC9526778.1 hypothetical protein [uncultured Gammaproteobacteria bacterium]
MFSFIYPNPKIKPPNPKNTNQNPKKPPHASLASIKIQTIPQFDKISTNYLIFWIV